MPGAWRVALDRALAANGITLEDLFLRAYPDTLAQAWLTGDLANRPTASEYLSLSDLSGVEVEVLAGDVDPASTLSVAMRSRGQTAPRTALERAVRLLKAARAVLRLAPHNERLLALRSIQEMFQATVPDSEYTARQAGKRAAMQFRALTQIGNSPILDLPSTIENLGVAVEFSTDMPDGLHGMTSWSETVAGWIACISVNARDRWTVQRYSLAHEFSHVLHQDRPNDLTTELVDDPRIQSGPAEARAEAFAGHLLVPPAGLANHWNGENLNRMDQGTAVANVMWRWGVSREAACYSLEACARANWTRVDTERAKSLRVSDMIQGAGLSAEWELMEATEGIFEPSAWLMEATAELFLSSCLPVENFASVSRQEPGEAIAQLLA